MPTINIVLPLFIVHTSPVRPSRILISPRIDTIHLSFHFPLWGRYVLRHSLPTWVHLFTHRYNTPTRSYSIAHSLIANNSKVANFSRIVFAH